MHKQCECLVQLYDVHVFLRIRRPCWKLVSWLRRLARCWSTGLRQPVVAVDYRRAQMYTPGHTTQSQPEERECADAALVTIVHLVLPGWKVARSHTERPTPIGCDGTRWRWRSVAFLCRRPTPYVSWWRPEHLVRVTYIEPLTVVLTQSIVTLWSAVSRRHVSRQKSRRHERRLRHWQLC